MHFYAATAKNSRKNLLNVVFRLYFLQILCSVFVKRHFLTKDGNYLNMFDLSANVVFDTNFAFPKVRNLHLLTNKCTEVEMLKSFSAAGVLLLPVLFNDPFNVTSIGLNSN